MVSGADRWRRGTVPNVELAVVLPAHNEEQHLSQQLGALLAQQWAGDWELIVVDNNSTDGTAELVRKYASTDPRVRLVHASERSDKSYAVHAAVGSTDAGLLAFCDADDVVAPGWLAAIATGLMQHRVVTGPNELELLNPPWLASSRGPSGHDSVGTFNGLFPFLRGNNYGVRRSVFDQIGPLREGHAPVEDLEFSYRCWKHGIKIVGLPDAIVHYRYRPDARTLWQQGRKYGKGRVRIARLLRDEGQPRPLRFGGWKSWAMLLLTLPKVVTKPGRARWLWIAGNRFGQVVGSIKYRTLML